METAGTATRPEIVPFHGDRIEAVRDGDTIYVAVRRICDNLGIEPGRQLQKLKGYHWASVGMMPTAAQGVNQWELAFIPVTHLAMWMTRTDPNRVAPDVAE